MSSSRWNLHRWALGLLGVAGAVVLSIVVAARGSSAGLYLALAATVVGLIGSGYAHHEYFLARVARVASSPFARFSRTARVRTS
ncbi:hypothetical protein ACFVX3_32665 [Rhodococcus erythropolis]